MSARARHLGRITQPAGKVELSAETRALVAELLRAHDDDTVTLSEFLGVALAMHGHLAALSHEERLEVSGRIIAATLGGRYVGWGVAAL